MKVYAYGIKLDVQEIWESPDQPTGYRHCERALHYWVDANLQYGEQVKETGGFPNGIEYVHNPRIWVQLHGPRDYTVANSPIREVRP